MPSNSSSSTDTRAKILEKINDLYVNTGGAADASSVGDGGGDGGGGAKPGFMELAADLGLKIVPPSDKIVVLLLGNHSAGKSSFINWYIDEVVQRESKATETSVFTFVTHGKRRHTLEGRATLENFKHFAEIKDIAGIAQCLQTEVVTSKAKKFPYIMFIDTPGLQDNSNYPYDIEKGITWLGAKADLVFVMFDPHGCANVKKTLDVTEQIQKEAGADVEKIKYALTKADLAGGVVERQKILQQTVQKLCQRPCLNSPTLEIKTIFLEGRTENDVETNKLENQLPDLVKDMHNTINTKIQRTLVDMETDVNALCKKIDERLAKDRAGQTTKMMNYVKALGFALVWLVLPLVVFLAFIVGTRRLEDESETDSAADQIAAIVPEPLLSVGGAAVTVHQLFGGSPWVLGVAAVVELFLTFKIRSLVSSGGDSLSWKKKHYYKEVKEWLSGEVLELRQDLYDQYFKDLGIADN
jgi:GTPase Era involved in 16S rRNA processing